MSVAFARRLLGSRVLSSAQVGAALLESVASGRAFVRVLVERFPEVTPVVERELARVGGSVVRALRPRAELVELLPRGACERLFVVPHRGDARTGPVEFATAYPVDRFLRDELTYLLDRPVLLVRTPIRELMTALELPVFTAASLRSEPPHDRTPAFGTPAARSFKQPSVPRIGVIRVPGDDEGTPIPLLRRPSLPPPGAPPPADDGSATARRRLPTNPGVGAPASSGLEDAPDAIDDEGEPVLGLTRKKEHDGASDPDLAMRRVLQRLAAAETPDAVTDHLADALGRAARRVLVFAVQSKGFRGRACRGCGPLDARALFLLEQEAEPLLRAVRDGHFLGAIPNALAGLEHHVAVGDQAYAVSVRVGERAVLVVLLVGLRGDYESSRLADRLSATAGTTLERLVLARRS